MDLPNSNEMTQKVPENGPKLPSLIAKSNKKLSKEWNFGIEIHYAKSAQSKRTEMLTVYMHTHQQQELWSERLDRIILSNKSTMALRLNRKARSRERSLEV